MSAFAEVPAGVIGPSPGLVLPVLLLRSRLLALGIPFVPSLSLLLLDFGFLRLAEALPSSFGEALSAAGPQRQRYRHCDEHR